MLVLVYFNIARLAEHLQFHIRERFGIEQLALVNVLVRHKVCLASLIKYRMYGATQAQYLKRQSGLVVYHRRDVLEDKTVNRCVIQQHGTIIYQLEDDPWASLTVLMIFRLWKKARELFNVFRKFASVPAHAVMKGFDAEALVKKFDFDNFDDNMLPILANMSDPVARRLVQEYRDYVKPIIDAPSSVDYLSLFDWILETRVFMRTCAVKGDITIPSDVKTDVEQLANIQGAEFVKITNPSFKICYQTVHPTAIEVGDVLVIHPNKCRVNVFGLPIFELPEIDFEKPCTAPLLASQDVVDSSTHVLGDIEPVDSDLVLKVVNLLQKPRQKMTAYENEFLTHGGHPEMIDTEGGFGKSALKGLRCVIGVGPVDECITRLTKHFMLKISYPEQVVRDFAAGRIAGMQGEYRAELREKTWYLQTKVSRTGPIRTY